MERRRTFSRKFKLEAVKLVTQRGAGGQGPGRGTCTRTCCANGFASCVRRRKRAFPGNGKQMAQDAEIARLRKEVAKLKMERDILKKAAVSFAKEST